MVLAYIIVTLIALLAYFLHVMNRIFQYWRKLRVVHPKPLPFFGNSLPIFLRKLSLSDLCEQVYNQYPEEKFIGIFDFVTPTLIVKDPQLLEKILVKDFHHFTDHSVDNQSGDLFSYTLFQMTGNRWRSVRYKISPTFTSGKLKLMFEQMLECSEEMLKTIHGNIDKDYEIKTTLSTYSLDIIANVVFGMKFMKDDAKNEFIEMCTTIFDTNVLQFLHMFLLLHFPKLANKFGVTFAGKKTNHYFRRIIYEAFVQRTAGQTVRNDYLQMLIKLKEKGSIEVPVKDTEDAYLNLGGNLTAENVEITNELLAGQAFQFLIAGLDPVFLTMTYTMYELAKNAVIQERLRKEIEEALANNLGCYTYQTIRDLNYLEQCIQETLRLYPIAPVLFRKCTKTYILEDLKIEKGLKLVVPVNALHMDPHYFPDPEVFNPDRFAPDVKCTNFTYLPFGNGPRICIGFRFAMIVMKLGLAQIIQNFKFTLSPKTKQPLEFNKLAFLKVTTNKIWFNLEPI